MPAVQGYRRYSENVQYFVIGLTSAKWQIYFEMCWYKVTYTATQIWQKNTQHFSIFETCKWLKIIKSNQNTGIGDSINISWIENWKIISILSEQSISNLFMLL